MLGHSIVWMGKLNYRPPKSWFALSIFLLFLLSRGLLQFPNVTYGIEPLESAHGFQHIVYQTSYDNTSLPLSTGDYHIKWSTELIQKIDTKVPVSADFFKKILYMYLDT